MEHFTPGYLALYETGELKRRADRLHARLAKCDICPRNCGVDRLAGERGFCHSGASPIVASICAHNGEEPPLSGKRGSGTIFFGNCNLRCVFCQNYQISQDWKVMQSKEVEIKALAEYMLYLQDTLHCHNINFVSPSHFVPQIMQAVLKAIPQGLYLPLVYNTGGYDSIDVINELNGVIDIYLPDIRYAGNKWAKKFSLAPDYVEHNRAAIKEMYRQVGNLVVDVEGIAQRGVIVRHLILPEHIAGSEASLTWLANEVSPWITVSVMSQYHPMHRAPRIPLLSRKISFTEYTEVKELLENLEIENGWVQEMDSAENYLPDFAREGHPFEPGAKN